MNKVKLICFVSYLFWWIMSDILIIGCPWLTNLVSCIFVVIYLSFFANSNVSKAKLLLCSDFSLSLTAEILVCSIIMSLSEISSHAEGVLTSVIFEGHLHVFDTLCSWETWDHHTWLLPLDNNSEKCKNTQNLTLIFIVCLFLMWKSTRSFLIYSFDITW